MRPLVVTPGEPAGIGPDIVLTLAACGEDPGRPWFVIADPEVLTARAEQIGLPVRCRLIEAPELGRVGRARSRAEKGTRVR